MVGGLTAAEARDLFRLQWGFVPPDAAEGAAALTASQLERLTSLVALERAERRAVLFGGAPPTTP